MRERGPERLEVRAGVERPRVLVPGEHPRDGIGVVRPGGLLNAEEWCHVSNTFDRSLVGAACVADEGEEELEYEPYVKKYGEQLEEVARANFNDYADMAEHFQARSIHWSPYDPVRVVNADP